MALPLIELPPMELRSLDPPPWGPAEAAAKLFLFSSSAIWSRISNASAVFFRRAMAGLLSSFQCRSFPAASPQFLFTFREHILATGKVNKKGFSSSPGWSSGSAYRRSSFSWREPRSRLRILQLFSDRPFDGRLSPTRLYVKPDPFLIPTLIMFFLGPELSLPAL